MRATNSPLTRGIHHIFRRQGLSAFSARRRRTVSRERLACAVSRTISPASGLWRKLGDDGLRRVAYRGGSRSLPGRDGRSTARRWPGSPRPPRAWPGAYRPDRDRPGRGTAAQDPRPRPGRERGPGPLHLPNPAALGAANEGLGGPAAGPLPARGLDRRLPGGARSLARQGCPEPLAAGDRPAEGRLAGRVRALARARPVGPALRLPLGRRRLPAGPDGAATGVYAGGDRRHARGREGAGRLPGRHPRERAELAGAAGRAEGPRPGDRARAGGRRRRARLLEGARGGVPGHAAPAVLGVGSIAKCESPTFAG